MSGATHAWTVPADHPAFPGHFPGRPIVPGALLLDRAVLLAAADRGCCANRCRVASAKFFSPVGPGETVDFAFSPAPGGGLRCDMAVAGRAVATASLAFVTGARP